MVDRIPEGSQPMKIRPGHVTRSEESSKAQPPDAQHTKPASSPHADESRISVDAAEIARYQELAQLHMEAYADVEEASREDKLARIKQRVQDGYYDRPEVMDALTDSLVRNTVEETGPAENLDVVNRRVNEAYYDRPDVVDKTADRVTRAVLPNQAPPEE